MEYRICSGTISRAEVASQAPCLRPPGSTRSKGSWVSTHASVKRQTRSATPSKRDLPDADRTAQLARLDRSSLRDQASQSIRASVAAGEFEAGKIYPVAFFENKLGVSATPIREALFDLVGGKLIEAVPNRGFRVPIRSERELDELFDLRMLLERPAVVRLASNPNHGDLGRLREVAEQIVREAARNDVRGFLVADRRFHHELLLLGDNQRLTDIVMGLRDQTRLYGLRALANSGGLVESARLHLEMLVAIETGDVDRADDSIVRHLGYTRGEWAAPDPAAPASIVGLRPNRLHR
jgi:DNA-binding GntR family transcriptional regulator